MNTRRSWKNQSKLFNELGGGAMVKQRPFSEFDKKKTAKEPKAVKPVAEHWTAEHTFKADPISRAITALVEMHRALHDDCKDEGPNTCPTWEALYGLRTLVSPSPKRLDDISMLCGCGTAGPCAFHSKKCESK